MNYKNLYTQLIEKAKERNLTKIDISNEKYIYCEYHHIKPRRLYPELEFEPSNIVGLTAKEHFVAHKLLVKIYEKDFGKYSYQYNAMITALNLMSSENKGSIRISSRTYSKIRTEFSYIQHLRTSGSKNPMFGKSIKDHMTEEKYEIWLAKHRGENHQFFGKKRPEHSKKMSNERNPMFCKSLKDHMSEEKYEAWLNKVRNNKNGKQNPFYGKHHTKEAIDKIKTGNLKYILEHNGHGPSYGKKKSPEQIKKNSESHRHPYSHDRKIKQNKTTIKKCCGHLCDLKEFDFELYITLSQYDKVKYRKQYIKTHPKSNET